MSTTHPDPSEPRTAAPPGRADRVWVGLIALLGVGQVANGIWMLLDPGHWYTELPTGVPDFGPLNIHFVRDIGCAFLTTGFALLVAWRVPRWRLPLVAVAALFAVAHAVLHVHDSARGVVEADHWWLDLPGVYLPAAVLVFAVRYFYQREQSANSSGN